MTKMRHVLPLALASALAFAPLAAHAADPAGGNLISGPWASDGYRSTSSSMVLAQLADRPSAAGPDDTEKASGPWYGRNNMHKYLGLGSLALAGLTVVAPKERGGAHENLAKGAAALGAAAVATGFYAHGEDIEWDWSDPDTRHAVYGALGTLGYLLAVARDGEGGHAAAGALGAVAMVAAIKITW